MIRIDGRLLTVFAAAAVLIGTGGPAGAGVVQRSTGLWPDGQVRYAFGPGITAGDQAAVRLAMRSWTLAGAPVRFVTATSGPRLIVLRHQSTDGANRCRATVGRGGLDRLPPHGAFERFAGTGTPPVARSFLILSGPCRHRVLVHEIGHVLGLDHEHERSDRSNWLSVRRLPRRLAPDPPPWPNATRCGDRTMSRGSIFRPTAPGLRPPGSGSPPGSCSPASMIPVRSCTI